ncbi:DMT family transporter [Gordonia liuliyuniae]|uniref:DMT family transporter n=1 Tax=Gordonia liuliyuniae TaxID=2911517 RepID=A0ABS9IVX7_9ACTN|nr:DMT family transporter [Gordonia liuliyuniae]MCF8589723.1 DMT family transporter [Gordonia liuliyuniae]
MHTWIPALLAIAAALLIAIGTVLRQRSSAASGAITAGWWIGAAVALSGFSLQASALGLGSILLVQPLVVLAVLFVLPMEAWADHRRPRRSEWAWGGVLVACVVAFLLIARPVSTDRRPDVVVMGGTVGAVVAGLIALVVVAECKDNRHHKALLYGLASGALFGVSSLLIKAVAIRVVDGPLTVFVHYEVYLLVPVVVLGVVAQQRSFGSGDLQTSFPAMNVMEPTVAMVLGVALLGESLKVGVPATIVLVVVLALAIVAVAELAKAAAIRGDQRSLACVDQ